MKNVVFLIIIFLTACSAPRVITPAAQGAVRTNPYASAAPHPDGLGDAFYPTLGNPGYDVNHYDLALTVDPVSNTLSGVATIEAVALEELAQFNLDMSGLEVDSVSVDGAAAEFSRRQTELTITPRNPLAAKSAFTVAVTYHGSPVPLTDEIIHIPLGWQAIPGGSFVVSEPSGAMNWFPSNNHWSDKATFTFRVTVPEGYDVVANGRLEESVSETPGYSTQVWVESAPMSTYLATVVIGRYQVQEQESARGVDIINYFPKGTPAEVQDSFAKTPQMVDFFSELVAPYPFENYGVVVVNMPLGFALETQTRSLYGNQPANEEVVAHELAHQWFGDNLTIATWQDLWLKEGFATYLSWLWLEHTQGQAAFEQKVQAEFDATVMSQYGLFFSPVAPARPLMAYELYGPATYQRGALTLHALRLEVGDEMFFEIVRTFYTRYAGQTASSADFIAVAQEISGQDWSAFFELWLETDWMPAKP